MGRQFTFTRILLVLGIALTVTALPSALYAQDEADESGGQVTILTENITSTGGAAINFDFAVRDADGYGIRDLSPGQVRVSEATADVTLAPNENGTFALAFIVDLSQGTDATLVRETLRSYFVDAYQAGDDVTFYVLAGDEAVPVVTPIDSRDDALALIETFQTQPDTYTLDDTLLAVLNDFIEKREANPGLGAHVIHVGTFLPFPEQGNNTTPFADEAIPYHVVQTQINRTSTAMRQLAEQGGGLYVDNEAGDLVLDDVDTAVGELRLLYDVIQASRVTYSYGYRSTSGSFVNPRRVTLSITLPDDTVVQDPYSYNVVFQPPRLTFTNPNQFNPVLTPDRNPETLAITFEEETVQPVMVQVNFPDGIDRPLELVRLSIVETDTGQIQQSTLQTSNLDSDGRLQLEWDLAEYRSPDTTSPVELTVLVEDVTGRTTSVTQSGAVVVLAAPPLPTPTPQPTVVPVAAEQQGNGEGVGVIAFGVGGQSASGSDDGSAAGGLTATTIALLFLVFAVLVVMLILAVSRTVRVYRLAREGALLAPEPEPKVISEEPAAPEIPQDEVIEPEEEELVEVDPNLGVFARLIIRNGEDAIDNLSSRLVEVRAEEFIIGRSPEADWVIDSPYVSPSHCRLISENGEYFVRDMNSKNGTFINGERIDAGRTTSLPVGSELGITKRIIVQVWDPQMDIDEFDLTVETRAQAGVQTNALEYKPLPGIPVAVSDQKPIDDDYSPL